MMTNRKSVIKPEKYIAPIAIAPGITVKEFADRIGITQIELAVRMNITAKHLSKLINGEVELTREIARKLEVIFGFDVSFWMNLENSYREKLFSLNPPIVSPEEQEIARLIPYKELCEMGLVAATRKIEEKVLNLKKFFAIVDLTKIPEINVAYKKANICKENPYALSAWIRIAELQAQKIDTGKFDKKELAKLIPEFKKMTLQEPQVFFPKLQELCASVGIALVLANHISGTGIRGATFLNSKRNKVVIQLSVRGKFADKFWFAFFHEISHILSDNDGTFAYIKCDEDVELEMDKMARNFLIPDDVYFDFVKSGAWSTLSGIQSFSSKLEIHPCILVGRLKFDGYLPYTKYTDMAPKFKITN